MATIPPLDELKKRFERFVEYKKRYFAYCKPAPAKRILRQAASFQINFPNKSEILL